MKEKFKIIAKKIGKAKSLSYICRKNFHFNIAQAKIWQEKYAEYLKTIPKGSNCYKHFYGWMFTEIYRGLRSEGLKD